jgi:hypothetical protein
MHERSETRLHVNENGEGLLRGKGSLVYGSERRRQNGGEVHRNTSQQP